MLLCVAPGLETVNCRRVRCCVGARAGVAIEFVVVYCPHVMVTCDDCLELQEHMVNKGGGFFCQRRPLSFRFRNVFLALILGRFNHFLSNRHNGSLCKISSEKMVACETEQPGWGMYPLVEVSEQHMSILSLHCC